MPKKSRFGGFVTWLLLVIFALSFLVTILGCLALLDTHPLFAVVIGGSLFAYCTTLVLFIRKKRTTNHTHSKRNTSSTNNTIHITAPREKIKKVFRKLKHIIVPININNSTTTKGGKEKTKNDKNQNNNLKDTRIRHNTPPREKS